MDEKIPANIIIEFARIYGFQVDFQRDIRKQDKFQIMYEIFINDKNKIPLFELELESYFINYVPQIVIYISEKNNILNKFDLILIIFN